MFANPWRRALPVLQVGLVVSQQVHCRRAMRRGAPTPTAQLRAARPPASPRRSHGLALPSPRPPPLPPSCSWAAATGARDRALPAAHGVHELRLAPRELRHE